MLRRGLTTLWRSGAISAPPLQTTSQAAAPACGFEAYRAGSVTRSNSLFTSSQCHFSLRPDSENDESAIKDQHDSPEQKKGVVTDPDIAPPKKSSPKQQTPSSKKTNELEKGAGAPAGDNYLNPGEVPKAGKDGKGDRGFSTSARVWADDDTAKGVDSDSPFGHAKGDDDAPAINRGPSGRPDDPHMQVDQAADDHPAPKAG